jgi:membrane protease YdiL (CAAX protease family)
MNQINFKKVGLYLALTFFFSWIILPIYFALGFKFSSQFTLVALLVYMFIPMTVTVVVQKLIFHDSLRVPFGIWFKPNRWFLYAWLLPLVLGIVTMGVSLLLPGIRYTPGMDGMFERYASQWTPEQIQAMRDSIATSPLHPFWLAIIQGLVAGVTINAVAGFGEELGWRGLLQKELEPLGFWKSSLLIGVIWGIWHAPIILQGYNYPQHPQLGVLMMTIFTTLFAPLIGFARVKSKSVIAAAIMHGTLNGTAGIAILLIAGGDDLTIGLLGLSGFIVMLIANVILFFMTRRKVE